MSSFERRWMEPPDGLVHSSFGYEGLETSCGHQTCHAEGLQNVGHSTPITCLECVAAGDTRSENERSRDETFAQALAVVQSFIRR